MIGLMGLFALILTLTAAKVFEHKTLDNQRTLLEQLLARKVEGIYQQLRIEIADLALALQAETEFRHAFSSQLPELITATLAKQFQRQFANDGIIRLQRIGLYDQNLIPLGRTADPMLKIEPDIACGSLVEQAATRMGTERSKILYALCAARGHAYFSLLAPIGGLRPLGFVQLEVDPIIAFAHLETEMGMPIRIVAPTGQAAFQSPDWPNMTASTHAVFAQHVVYAASYEPVFTIIAAYNVETLNQNLDRTLLLLLLSAAVITLIVIVTMRVMLSRSLVTPLERLVTHLQVAHHDKQRLGEPIEVKGDLELRQLATTFNVMTAELRSLYGTLQYMAFTDPLTCLPNRLQLQENLNYLLTLYADKGLSFALFIIDVDRYNGVDNANDAVSNALLKIVATRLQEALRSTDFLAHIPQDHINVNVDNVARLGGDEFAALLPLVGDTDQAKRVATNALDVMRTPFELNGSRIKVDISIGIALFPLHRSDAAGLLRCADIAMYEAKRQGRGCVVFETGQEQDSVRQFDLERDLRQALARGQLDLHYQPQVHMKSRRVVGVEALMRWHHHDQDMIPPDFFIPLAEQINMIRPLTFWALEQAIRDCARWRRVGRDLGVAVNITPMCLHDPSFVTTVLRLLAQWQVSPSALTLEITERGHYGQLPNALPAIAELNQAGVQLSVDDFGVGYPTLAQLKNLPVHQLKIDRSFVLDMLLDASDAGIVRATIDIARHRNLEVVAEGVELQSHWNALADYGVDIAQGYLIARPMSHADLLHWLEANTAGESVWIPLSSAISATD
ncbi:MAG: EAL domain-containing protein [Gammaproteobacteria bacterium]|nr:EAL domain-containing protein [Gammaproteobacteria bacterium]